MKYFSNRNLLVLLDKLTTKIEGSIIFLNFRRNNIGVQGLLKIPYKNNDFIIIYIERKVKTKELLEEDFQTHINNDLIYLLKEGKLKGLENLFNINKTKVILVSHVINEQDNKNLIRISKTTLNIFSAMTNLIKMGILIKPSYYHRWSYVERKYTNYSEEVENKLLSDFFILLFNS